MAGESRGLWLPTLTESGLASVSMGYQVSVTPLQMAAAASAVANGGLLLEPHVVRAVERDGQRTVVAPKVLRRAISARTAATLTSIMEEVVVRGTAKQAQVRGYHVAGKTGTSNKAIPGGYSNDHNASFVGFVPARRPAFTILVVIDTPRAGPRHGGTVAAPIFQKIAEAALVKAGLPKDVEPDGPVFVRAAAPLLPRRMAPAAALVPTLTPVGGAAVMPDLRGLSGREALRVLAEIGLPVRRVSGTGFVVRQQPDAGRPIVAGGSSALELRRSLEGGSSREGDVP
jgi:membrane peptidoglycan carboxypeptidase